MEAKSLKCNIVNKTGNIYNIIIVELKALEIAIAIISLVKL